MTTTGYAPWGTGVAYPGRSARTTLAVATIAFFMITLDAVVVNVALPTLRDDLGGGMTDLQWVVDGYTLMFAALLLSAGAVTDRLGARRALGVGFGVFVVASLACGLATSLPMLVAARFLQGSAAALMTPSSLALIHRAYPDQTRRARAVALWAMGGSVAATSGPVLGGLLTSVSWRLIFLVNVPVGVVALALLRRTVPTARRAVPFDLVGQVTAVLAMGGLTFAAIEAGSAGLAAPHVVAALAVAIVAIGAFLVSQARGSHPMVPLVLLRNPSVSVPAVVGFAFMIGYFGMPFVLSLDLQQQRGLPVLATSLLFLPMMLVGAILTPFSARIVERVGPRVPIVTGLGVMATGLVALTVVPAATPDWILAALMMLVGLGGPLVMPPATAVLLNGVPSDRAGTASGVLNTSRQVGGALAVAVFGSLLAGPDGFRAGMQHSLVLAAGVTAVAALVTLTLHAHTTAPGLSQPSIGVDR